MWTVLPLQRANHLSTIILETKKLVGSLRQQFIAPLIHSNIDDKNNPEIAKNTASKNDRDVLSDHQPDRSSTASILLRLTEDDDDQYDVVAAVARRFCPSFGRRLELLSFDRVVIVVVRDRRNFAAVSFSSFSSSSSSGRSVQ